ncbi:hypothetical protein BSKO_10863 [Bryopsis sp. KO-2023]|nr:hypothetical protein BSKO_10863 [Bryopsis sp. KO-2023]
MGMLFVNQPALADNIQTVPAADVTQYAQPLQKQEIKKSEIWLVFVVGTASLFGATLVLENNSSLFPAISKANKAMKISNKQAEQAEAKLPEVTPKEITSSPSVTA